MRIKTVIYWIIFSILYLLHAIINGACDWYNIRFGVSIEEILFTLMSPMEGADTDFLGEAVTFTLPYIFREIPIILLFMIISYVLSKIVITIQFKILKLHFNLKIKSLYKFCCIILAIYMLYPSLNYAVISLSLDTYISRKLQQTTIYEDYYADPKTTTITCDGDAKNLIFIYLESMETTYASTDVGGAQTENYIPNLTALANENISFSDTELLGGAYSCIGTGWTMGALFSTTTGIPFSFPVQANSNDTYAENATALGDLLNDYGYRQVFLCGSSGSFAGKGPYFELHGDYDIHDYRYAIEQEYIPDDYKVWWGYEDAKLYDFAKIELLELVEEDTPFNFTMLTVDTHHVDGYVCQYCDTSYDHQLKSVITCTDRLTYDFITWCQEQSFYEDTVIVLVGDHYRMDTSLVAEANALGTRRLYNCIINADKDVQISTQNRIFTPMDIFPTTLSAMGYTIEGGRLGLGTDLFSDRITLAEEIGIDVLNIEISKYSDYYLETFD